MKTYLRYSIAAANIAAFLLTSRVHGETFDFNTPEKAASLTKIGPNNGILNFADGGGLKNTGCLRLAHQYGGALTLLPQSSYSKGDSILNQSIFFRWKNNSSESNQFLLLGLLSDERTPLGANDGGSWVAGGLSVGLVPNRVQPVIALRTFDGATYGKPAELQEGNWYYLKVTTRMKDKLSLIVSLNEADADGGIGKLLVKTSAAFSDEDTAPFSVPALRLLDGTDQGFGIEVVDDYALENEVRDTNDDE